MNRKFEDKLVRLAFGDTSPKESSSLERKLQSDPEAARALEEYRQLKSGLTMLNDIPPDQLSKERLRHAILTQGLKPLPAENPSPWSWAWMPVAAAALAFGWLGVRHMSTPEPRLVQSASLSAMNTPVKPIFKAPAPVQVAVAKPTPPTAADEHPAHLVVQKHAPSQHTPKPILAVSPFMGPTLPKGKTNLMVATNDRPKTAPVTADPAEANGRLASVNGPLVVINPENDNNSGAQKATEVDGASDVGPVGG